MASLRARSDSMVSWISWKIAEGPPTATVRVSVSRVYSSTRSCVSAGTAPSSPAMRAKISAWVPSVLRRGGALPRLQ